MRWLMALMAMIVIPTSALAQTSASPFTIGYRYNLDGQVTGTIAPDPDDTGPLHYPAVRTSYDPAGRAIKVETGELAAWQSEAVAPSAWSNFTVFTIAETTYDAGGRKIKETIAGNPGSGFTVYAVTQYSYDVLGNLECTAVRMNPAVFNSLPSSACTLGTSGTQGADRITRNVYDQSGRLQKVQKAYGITTANGYATTLQQDYATYTYTANGKLETMTDANGNKASMTYDGLDRQVRWNFPDKVAVGSVSSTDFEAYEYDANDNRTKLTKRDTCAINFAYDALNRMTLKDLPSGVIGGVNCGTAPDVYFGYDLRGLQLYARFLSPSGLGITNTYDNLGRQLTSTNDMGTARTVSYQYDPDGNRVRVTYPDSVYVGYHYDGIDRFDTAGIGAASGLIARTYDSAGRLVQNTSGSITYYTYDPLGRLTLQNETAGSGAAVQTGLGYNPAGQIVTRSRSNDAYAFSSYATHSYGYVANGLNQYATVGSNTYGYDPNGNLTYDGGITYTYDVENRLVSTSAGTNLVYDPLGRLYETNVNGGSVTRFMYSGDELLVEYNASGTVLKRYVHGPGTDDPLAWLDGASTGGSWSNVHLAKPDYQGSLTLWTDWNGGSPQINSYDEYGVPAASNVGRFQYTGQAWIPELGMYYYKARFYSPMLGRFLQVDPVGYADQNNLYTYVGNDPMNLGDPTGMMADRSTGTNDPLDPCGSAGGYVSASCSGASILNMLATHGGQVVPGSQGRQSNPGTGNQRRTGRQRNGSYIAPTGPGTEIGDIVASGGRAKRQIGDGECVTACKHFSGVPGPTGSWRPGATVLGNRTLPIGTAIATFAGRNGRFENGGHQNSGIYMGQGPHGGVMIIDQWPGHPPALRELRPHVQGDPSNSADAYRVIIVQ